MRLSAAVSDIAQRRATQPRALSISNDPWLPLLLVPIANPIPCNEPIGLKEISDLVPSAVAGRDALVHPSRISSRKEKQNAGSPDDDTLWRRPDRLS